MLSMDDPPSIRRFLAYIGRRGGKARAQALTADERRRSATKASKAAARARTRKAKLRKAARRQEVGNLSPPFPGIYQSERSREKVPMDKEPGDPPPEPRRKHDFNDFSDWLVPGAKLPDYRSDFQDVAELLDWRLSAAFLQQEKEAGREIPLDSSNDAGRRIIEDSWDEYIFDSIQEYGPFVLFSYLVVRRIYAWQFDASYIEKLQRLGDELAKAARIRHGGAKGKIGRKHVLAKKLLVPELSRLRISLRDAWPKDQDIVAFLDRELCLPNSPYPNLAINGKSLLDFLTKHPDVAVGFRGIQRPSGRRTAGRSGDVTPVQLYVSWLAHSENRSEESVRQDLHLQSKHVKPSIR
jgi:hypothetical protein